MFKYNFDKLMLNNYKVLYNNEDNNFNNDIKYFSYKNIKSSQLGYYKCC